MAVQLNHTIVMARNKEASARFSPRFSDYPEPPASPVPGGRDGQRRES